MEQEVLDNWLIDGRQTAAHQFRADLSRYPEARKLFVTRFWIMLVSLLALILSISIIKDGFDFSYRTLIPLGAMTLVYSLLAFFRLRSGIARHRTVFESYVLTLDEDCITREQHQTPVIKIRRNEIKSITRRGSGIIVIKGATRPDTIYIGRQVERPEELLTRLQQYAPVKVTTQSLYENYGYALNIIAIGLMLGVIYSEDKRIVVSCGLPLLGWYIFGIVQRIRNKNIPYTNRFSVTFNIVVFVGMIVFVTYRLLH